MPKLASDPHQESEPPSTAPSILTCEANHTDAAGPKAWIRPRQACPSIEKLEWDSTPRFSAANVLMAHTGRALIVSAHDLTFSYGS
jgi:hypothetical protein